MTPQEKKTYNDMQVLIDSAADYIDMLGGVSTRYRQALTEAKEVQEAPAAQPLRGEQIHRIAMRLTPKMLGMVDVPTWVIPFARAIEAAHGIGAKEQQT